MKTVIIRLSEAVSWVVIGLLVAVVTVILRGSNSAGAFDASYVYWGMDSSVDCGDFQHDPVYYIYWLNTFASCWHEDEGTTDAFGNTASYSAIDYTNSGGQTAGTLVQLWYTGATLRPQFQDLPAASGTCTGVRVDTYNSLGAYMGDIHYLHIDVYANVKGTSWQNYNRQWDYFWRDLGTVSASQPSGCTTTGPHLHQSANRAGWTPIYSNGDVNPTNTWEHRVVR